MHKLQTYTYRVLLLCRLMMLFLQVIIRLFLVLQILPSRFSGLDLCSGFVTYAMSFAVTYLYVFIVCLSMCQTWNCLSNGTCTRTLRQHSDYVTCLAAAEKNVIFLSNFYPP